MQSRLRLIGLGRWSRLALVPAATPRSRQPQVELHRRRHPHPGYSYRFCDDGLPPSRRHHAEPGGNERRQGAGEIPPTAVTTGRAAAEGPDATHDAGRRHRGRHRARRRHLDADDSRAAGRLSADRVDARLLLRQQDELGGDQLRRRRREVALQQRLVRVARLRGHQLHGARLRQRRPQRRPGLHRRDPARLAPLRDQRLPVPGRPGGRRLVLQRQPAEGRRHRRLLRRRLLLDGAHRPDLERAPAART